MLKREHLHSYSSYVTLCVMGYKNCVGLELRNEFKIEKKDEVAIYYVANLD